MPLYPLPDKPFFIAHRGASRQAPENTLIAIQKAQELSLEWVEFDIMLSKDLEAILMHDIELKRTTSGFGQVCHFDYAELLQLDAGSWFDKKFKNERIPLLKNILLFLKRHQMKACLEIKPYPGFEKITASTTIKLLQTIWPQYHDHIMISSFSKEALVEAREHDRHITIGISTEIWDQEQLYFAEQLAAEAIHIDYLALNPEICQEIRGLNLDIFSYTINELTIAKMLFSWGVKAIFSDIANELQQAIRQ